ncbi:MAG: hypothetical protein ACREF0_21470 [Acetobacteraceae bacterium]
MHRPLVNLQLDRMVGVDQPCVLLGQPLRHGEHRTERLEPLISGQGELKRSA